MENDTAERRLFAAKHTTEWGCKKSDYRCLDWVLVGESPVYWRLIGEQKRWREILDWFAFSRARESIVWAGEASFVPLSEIIFFTTLSKHT
jgi:hypothetical protein